MIHVTGTNGKGSTSQMITRLLMAHGLTVGTYTSPHLERVNERMSRNGEPISDEEFAEQIAAVADLEVLDRRAAVVLRDRHRGRVPLVRRHRRRRRRGRGRRCSAAGTRRTSSDAQVAVITNIGIDHTEFAGPTQADIAAREGRHHQARRSAVVLGETDPELVADLPRRAAAPACCVRGDDFDVLENQLALGGRLLDLRTPTTIYTDVFLPLHGRHQGDNAAVALTAVEAFFGNPIADDRGDRAEGVVAMCRRSTTPSKVGVSPTARAACSIGSSLGTDLEVAHFALGRAQREVELDRLAALDDWPEQSVIGVRSLARLGRAQRHDLRQWDAIDRDDMVAGPDTGSLGRCADRKADISEIVFRQHQAGAAAEHQRAVFARRGETVIKSCDGPAMASSRAANQKISKSVSHGRRRSGRRSGRRSDGSFSRPPSLCCLTRHNRRAPSDLGVRP